MLKNSIYIFTIILLSIITNSAYAQTDNRKTRELTREGNEAYEKEDFKTSEEKYQMALSESENYFNANYNLANSLFKQKRYKDAAIEYEQLLPNSPNDEIKAQIYHNLGNCKLMAKEKDLDGGIEDYKNSLRLNPKAQDTRYNLSYAMELKKQQQQNKDQQNKDNKDNKDQNKDKKDQDKQNQDKQNQDKKDKEKQEQQENKDQKNKDKDKEQQQQQDKEEKGDKKDQQQQGEKKDEKKMSKKETERILKAMAEKEKDTKEKLQKKQVKVKAVKVEKDW